MLLLGCKPIKESGPKTKEERKRFAFALYGQLSRSFPQEHFVIKNKQGIYYVGYPYNINKENKAMEIDGRRPMYWDSIAKKEINND